MSTPEPNSATYQQIQLLLEEGWNRSQILHRFIQDNPINPMATWTPEFTFLAFLTYATSMAKLVEMDRADYLALTEALYDHIFIHLKATPTTGSSTTGYQAP